MECRLNLIVEQLENMLDLWQLKSIMKVEMTFKETFVLFHLQLMELIQQLHKYVVWRLSLFHVMIKVTWSQN